MTAASLTYLIPNWGSCATGLGPIVPRKRRTVDVAAAAAEWLPNWQTRRATARIGGLRPTIFGECKPLTCNGLRRPARRHGRRSAIRIRVASSYRAVATLIKVLHRGGGLLRGEGHLFWTSFLGRTVVMARTLVPELPPSGRRLRPLRGGDPAGRSGQGRFRNGRLQARRAAHYRCEGGVGAIAKDYGEGRLTARRLVAEQPGVRRRVIARRQSPSLMKRGTARALSCALLTGNESRPDPLLNVGFQHAERLFVTL